MLSNFCWLRPQRCAYGGSITNAVCCQTIVSSSSSFTSSKNNNSIINSVMRIGMCRCTNEIVKSSTSCSSILYSLRSFASNEPTEERSRSNFSNPATGKDEILCSEVNDNEEMKFYENALEHVRVPEIPMSRRLQSDVERIKEMSKRFGELGPGEIQTEEMKNRQKNMIQEQQDIDGLPWELRWKRSLIPTPEEVIQENRDRFDMFEMDEIEKMEKFYLYYYDADYLIQPDRLIWPQGFTDYLDKYDEHGRRRILPNGLRWSDSSWKHLAETKYKEASWLISSEEQKALRQRMLTGKEFAEETNQSLLSAIDSLERAKHGLITLETEGNPLTEMLTSSSTQEKIELGDKNNTLELTKGREQTVLERVPQNSQPSCAVSSQIEGKRVTKENVEFIRTVDGKESNTQMKEEERKQLEKRPKHEQEEYPNMEINSRSILLLREELKGKQEEEKQQHDDHHIGRIVHHESSKNNVNTLGVSKTNYSITSDIDNNNSNNNEKQEQVESKEVINNMTPAQVCTTLYESEMTEVIPPILTYDLIHDPIEVQPSRVEYYNLPDMEKEERQITNDDITESISVFDAAKWSKMKARPETLKTHNLLPFYREIKESNKANHDHSHENNNSSTISIDGSKGENNATSGAVNAHTQINDSSESNNNNTLRASEFAWRKRQARLKAEKSKSIANLTLPTLPWERNDLNEAFDDRRKWKMLERSNNSLVHQKRYNDDESHHEEISTKVEWEFNKQALYSTWIVYRRKLYRTLARLYTSLSNQQEAESEKVLLDAITDIKDGRVDAHPLIPNAYEEVIRLKFEHTLKEMLEQYYCEIVSQHNVADVIRTESNQLQLKIKAKLLQLNHEFHLFLEEMTAIEAEIYRRNSLIRKFITISSRKYLPIIRPFFTWMQTELELFINQQHGSYEVLQQRYNVIEKSLSDIVSRIPARLHNVSETETKCVATATYNWCNGVLHYVLGKLELNMSLTMASVELRNFAETSFTEAVEFFEMYKEISHKLVSFAIPGTVAPVVYKPEDFVEGESALEMEQQGDFQRAEMIWLHGMCNRWYSEYDKTDAIWYCERRGYFAKALDWSEQMIDNLLKHTHPSIYPFPERARIFLEGAPLTQETAEHIWQRHIADVYVDLSKVMERLGRFATAREFVNKALELYQTALGIAHEKLPHSWSAPLLTETKYLMNAYAVGKTNPMEYLERVDKLIARLFTLPEPEHWIETYTQLPFRIALIEANMTMFANLFTSMTAAKVHFTVSDEAMMHSLQNKVEGKEMPDALRRFKAASTEIIEEVYRRRILAWRDREEPNSFAYLYWTHLYFQFAIMVNQDHGYDEKQSAAKTEELWSMYEPVYRTFYNNCCMESNNVNDQRINDAIRRMCKILSQGSKKHKERLLHELRIAKEELSFCINIADLDRSISSLQVHLTDYTRPVYIYMSSTVYSQARMTYEIDSNIALYARQGIAEYAQLRAREKSLKDAKPLLQERRQERLEQQQHYE